MSIQISNRPMELSVSFWVVEHTISTINIVGKFVIVVRDKDPEQHHGIEGA